MVCASSAAALCAKEGRPWPGPVGVLDLQLPTGACLRGVFWCAGKPACWAFDRTIKRCPGRSQRQPASSDTLGKRSRSWRAILPKYLSPRTTRLRALPPLPPGRPCPSKMWALRSRLPTFFVFFYYGWPGTPGQARCAPQPPQLGAYGLRAHFCTTGGRGASAATRRPWHRPSWCCD